MKERFFIYALSLAGIASIAFSCEKDPVIPNQEELITTLIYTLTPLAGGQPVMLTFRDLDGDGGDPPVITSDNLQSNTQYAGVVTLLNESVQPAEKISEEILDEATDHQFFYEFYDNALASATYADMDSLGYPLGLETVVSTGDPSQGKLRITLRHLPEKDQPGVDNGQITNAGGDTDIEVIFDIRIQ